jgi:hypothetical protein
LAYPASFTIRTPNPTFPGRCSGCPTVNRASINMCRKRRTGALPAPPTTFDRHAEVRPAGSMRIALRRATISVLVSLASIRQIIFGLVAQSAERPVVCGRAEGATPFGSAIFTELTAGPFQGWRPVFYSPPFLKCSSGIQGTKLVNCQPDPGPQSLRKGGAIASGGLID